MENLFKKANHARDMYNLALWKKWGCYPVLSLVSSVLENRMKKLMRKIEEQNAWELYEEYSVVGQIF